MIENVALKYNAKIIEIKDNIKQLQTLGISNDKFNDAVGKIEDETNFKVKECYINYSKVDSNVFLHNSLINIYDNAIKQLDRINNYIVSEFEHYYIIQAKYKELNKKIKSIDNYNMEEMVKETLELLGHIKKFVTFDCEEEKVIIDNVYNLVYEMMKLELIYTNNDSLLEYVKSNDIDVSYIAKLIKDDIEGLENEELLNKIQEIEKKGFKDMYFLDKDLIVLLNVDNSNLTNNIKDKFLTRVDDYITTSEKLMEMKSNNLIISDTIKKIKKVNKKISIKRLFRKVLLLLNFGLLSSVIIASIVGCRNLTKTKEYKTITTTYDTSNPEDDHIIEYLPSIENSISMIEYSPWEEPGYFRDNYKRNVYTYNLDALELFYDDVKDYLNSDIKNSITVSEQVEVSSEIPKDDYDENKYVITQIVQDKNDYREVDNLGSWIALSLLSSGLTVFIDVVLLNFLTKVSLKELKYEHRNSKIELVENKQKLIKNDVCINELKNELLNLKTDIEKQYASLPGVFQQDKSIKEKMLLLKKEDINN